ncbi:alpha/beta hydrolase [Ralstonia pseudosolanacearum]|uniref:Alpha/beta hydrolase n=2 Tax=Ralstonia solanacearum species complex TaxID=3116862 RepID=A0A0S4X200_RALSL|nr:MULTISPECIES: alpha/beta hydrolase [Ralstonia]AUS42461.1 alpha/beta hydrolase [Ralstonia solanacearum]AYA46587.1 alpha/beta hydrolase [Ralstonia pseudosolanacearum]MCK4133045.1 alpha/beta hydrolase [Ralstonia pseudosolanacearum]MCK4144275.1 alpha/beta hydrolase [Ralstonia pseudosolanacearum]MDK1382732.1 alpha/beta hydrolase [Ralstonia pseudosolanacearum]
MPSLDPHVAQLLDLVARAKRPPLHHLAPADAKIAYEKSSPIVDIPPIPLDHVHDLTVPARDGYAIPVRTYAAREASWADPLPLLVYFHGGGFTVGSIRTHDALCRSLAAKSGAMVLSVDYRLGPDWKFPTAADDAFDVLQWVFDEAATIGADPARIAFGGDSAGGTLAAITAIEARNRGLAPVLQLLIYPGTTARETTPSHHAFAEGYLLTQAMIAWFFAQYLRSDADRDDWRFAPLDGGGQGADVRGVCPAWIAVAGFDPIRDAGIGYADKLRAAGVPVTLRMYEGMIHDFFKLGRFVPAVEDAHYEAAEALRRAFGTQAG